MLQCSYGLEDTKLSKRLNTTNMRRKINVFVIRQILLEIAVCLISYTTGIILAFPSVLNPAILASDADIKALPDQASWIVTCLSLGSLVGCVVIPSIFDFFGRKLANIVTNLFLLIGSLILYVAKDVNSLAFGRISQGLSMGGTFISGIALCECIPPKRRGYFMVLCKASLGLGSLTCHSLGFVSSWRQIALIGAIGNLISITIFTMSAESPSFLAMQGHFDKCAEAFEWYRGDSLNAKKELKELISAQTEDLNTKDRIRQKDEKKKISVYNNVKDMLTSKEFQKSLCIVMLATLCLDFCRRYIVLLYGSYILIQLTNSTTIMVHISIAIELLLLFALLVSTVLVKTFKRRTLLFKSGFCSVFSMFLVSFLIFVTSRLEFSKNLKWLTLSIVLISTFIINVGLVPIAYILSGEIFPLNHRGSGSFVSGITLILFFNSVENLTPYILDKIGLEGGCIVYGLLLLLFLVLLRTTVPETKDKTLQQIEVEIKGIMRSHSEIELLKHSKDNNC